MPCYLVPPCQEGKPVQLLVDEGRRINILCGSKEEHISIQRDLIPVTCFSRNRASQERPSHDVTVLKLYCHMSAFFILKST